MSAYCLANTAPAPNAIKAPPSRQATITKKAGNSAARRMRVEVAWHYRHAPQVSPVIATRQNGLPKTAYQGGLPMAVTDIAWKAQSALNAKFNRLLARRILKTKAVVAVARELAGFVWAIGQAVQRSGWKGLKPEPRPRSTSDRGRCA